MDKLTKQIIEETWNEIFEMEVSIYKFREIFEAGHTSGFLPSTEYLAKQTLEIIILAELSEEEAKPIIEELIAKYESRKPLLEKKIYMCLSLSQRKNPIYLQNRRLIDQVNETIMEDVLGFTTYSEQYIPTREVGILEVSVYNLNYFEEDEKEFLIKDIGINEDYLIVELDFLPDFPHYQPRHLIQEINSSFIALNGYLLDLSTQPLVIFGRSYLMKYAKRWGFHIKDTGETGQSNIVFLYYALQNRSKEEAMKDFKKLPNEFLGAIYPIELRQYHRFQGEIEEFKRISFLEGSFHWQDFHIAYSKNELDIISGDIEAELENKYLIFLSGFLLAKRELEKIYYRSRWFSNLNFHKYFGARREHIKERYGFLGTVSRLPEL